MSRDYLLVSPVRDEARFARRTLESVTRQTVPPARWIIVDDGSTDGTPEILAEYASRFPYIEVHRRDNRGERRVGPGVVEAFYDGLATVPDLCQYRYLCKLDLDLDLPAGYFETLVKRMEANPRLGTCSGKPYVAAPTNYSEDFGGPLIPETCGDETSVGMTKFYRVECFEQIGGFVREVMWDGIDCHMCRMHGWIACSWDDPELRFIHLRPMGSSQDGILSGRRRHGFGQFFMGTSFSYMTVSALYRTTKYPYVVGGAAMWWGYVEQVFKRTPRFDDPAFRQFLHRYQRRCLVLGKRRATERLNRRQGVRLKHSP